MEQLASGEPFRTRRSRRPDPGHDQQSGPVVDGGVGGLPGRLANTDVVAAQQQVNEADSIKTC